MQALSHVLSQKEVQGVVQCDLSFEGRQINQLQMVHMGCSLEHGISVYLCTIDC